ncbi:DUF2267 domain-containing protein [Pseudonocardia bannensis]|uniref:DUF2267 domain-containing protein n=1 Tax=Pseudonocardia bannensis TaxID=630973 RepID=A0A848DNH1_9PSEU|nr:DUF2267 domain-containing protein [Pseudonocardia bannensis]NMH94095.1 DUF2267 domain-containing protein [Pseudonocardia bannensis]
MKYDVFMQRFAERVGVAADKAEVLTRATLQTLAERITGGEAEDLAEQLPPELREPLQRPGNTAAEAFDLDEFVRRVGERAGVDEELARRATRALLLTLRDTLTPQELDDVVSQLPEEYRELLRIDYDEFMRRVLNRSKAPPDRVEEITRAVLQTLAERLSGGEARNLAEELPEQLREPLARPPEAHGRPIGLEEFLDLVAERAGVDEELARRATRAVLLTARDAISRKGYEHVLAQLPREMAGLL